MTVPRQEMILVPFNAGRSTDCKNMLSKFKELTLSKPSACLLPRRLRHGGGKIVEANFDGNSTNSSASMTIDQKTMIWNRKLESI